MIQVDMERKGREKLEHSRKSIPLLTMGKGWSGKEALRVHVTYPGPLKVGVGQVEEHIGADLIIDFV